MTGVSIVGVGMHPFGRTDGVSGRDQGAIAARAALADAGLGWNDIQFAAGGSHSSGAAGRPGLRPRAHHGAVRQRQQRLRHRRQRADRGRRDDHQRGGRRRPGGRVRQARPGRVQPRPRRLRPARLVRRRPG